MDNQTKQLLNSVTFDLLAKHTVQAIEHGRIALVMEATGDNGIEIRGVDFGYCWLNPHLNLNLTNGSLLLVEEKGQITEVATINLMALTKLAKELNQCAL